MRGKSKSSETTQAFESLFNSDALRDRIEQATKGFGDLASFNRQNIEAMVKAANTAAKSIEQINSEMLTYSRQAMEDGAAALKSMMGAGSVQEAMEAHAEYTKAAFDAYVGQMTKLQEIFTSAARESIEPISARMKSVMDQAKRPAA